MTFPPFDDFPITHSFFKFKLLACCKTITCSIHDFHEQINRNKFNEELSGVHQWLKCNKIKVNNEKSNFQIFSYRKTLKLSTIKLGLVID